MGLFVAGLLIFFVPHLFTSFARGARARLVQRLGERPYKGLYSAVTLIGFVLIILGWRQASTEMIYSPPDWGTGAAVILMTLSFILFAAAYLPAGRIKSLVGHPMVAGTILFGLAHLLANGDVRSVLLFGAFLAYGILDRIAVKLRGDTGPEGTSLVGDIGAVGLGLLSSYLVAHHLHRYVAGVGLDPSHFFAG